MKKDYNTDLIGKKFGFLEVLEKSAQKTKQGKSKWICKCHACGNIKEIPRASLIVGDAKSCGCKMYEVKSKNNVDLTDKTFGGLKVLRKLKGKGVKTFWECKCNKCGKIYPVVQSAIVKGQKSCGCLHTENAKRNINSYVGNINGTNASLINSKKNYSSNTSGHRGVSFNKKTNKWQAYIIFQGKLYNLGYYQYIENAIDVRKKAEEKIFGDFLKWFAEEFPERWEKINKK